LISDQQYFIFSEIFSTVCTCVSVLGCLGNLVTIRTFISMGVKDGVTLSFVFLTVSDLAYLVAMAAHAVALGLYVLERKGAYKVWFPVEPFGVYVFFSNVGILLYLLTMMTTTFLAVVRCMCVAMPLKFMNVFTKKSSILILSVFFVIAVASYFPILVFMRMVTEFDERVNATRSVLWISPRRDKVKEAVWISRDVAVTFVTQVIVTVCVIVMVKSLRTAAKFRQNFANILTPSKPTFQKNLQIFSVLDINGNGPGQKEHETPSAEKNNIAYSNKLSLKDMSVVKQVVLISVVYIVCNTPKILVDVTAMFVSDFTLGKSYQNLYLVVISLMELSQALNSSSSIIIYYRYNSRFRK
ncbi:unnamed protein product, partial [Lymnaea stagnalis]